MSRVALDKISKQFRTAKGAVVHALEGLSLTIESGEFLVLGPSGSGKTTLLRIIAGLDKADAGQVSMDGRVVDAVPPEHRDIAMVFQNGALYPHLTALENITLGLKLRKVPKAQIAQRVQESVAILGLNGLLDRLPRELSGGERQRVALARALARQPKILLMDEPLSNLDAPMRVELRDEIARIHQMLGATIIYVTHDQDEAMSLGNRIAVLHEGKLQQSGSPRQIYDYPANLFTAGFLGSPPMNLFRGSFSMEGTTLLFHQDTELVRIPVSSGELTKMKSHVGPELILGIRPELIRLEPSPSAGAMAAKVERVESFGAVQWVHLKAGHQRFIATTDTRSSSSTNDELFATFAPECARFFDAKTGRAIS